MSDRWTRIEAVFQDALERVGAERAAFLDAACGDDVALRREVDSLIAAHERAGIFEAIRTDGDEHDLVGGTLDDVYQIERVLGRGGMGVVYLGRHALLGDHVAIKVLSPSISRRDEWMERFLREGRAARAIRHPNAVIVHELRRTDRGLVYLVQEYVQGRTLRAELDERRVLDTRQALHVLGGIAGALDAAHARGVVHRDVKPENIMLASSAGSGDVKLLDLGIAKLREAAWGSEGAGLTGAGERMGTPAYMAPEQWGEPQSDGIAEVDGRADVYSLAVVAYEMLAGRRPFEDRAVHGLWRAHVGTVPSPLSEVAPHISRAASAAVDRSLAKDRASRPSTAGAFVGELAAGLAADADTIPIALSTGRQIALPTPPDVSGTPNNLPAAVTSLVGREHELRQVLDLLNGARLVTLTGVGGIGKTRLAVAAAALSQDYPDGVWLVELAGLSDGSLVASAVAKALGLREEGTGDRREALLAAVKSRRLLIVLDNCEHIVGDAAETAEALLRAGAGVRVLATSREVLGVQGEAVWSVPALDLPEAGVVDVEEVGRSSAVRLFVERAGLVRPGYALDVGNAPAIAEVCRRLEGIPLALELAAARMRVLTLDAILERTEDRLGLLVGGQRRAPERQRTLRAAIEWSYELLDADERALLRRLSVFVGGWTLEAATAASGPPSSEQRTADSGRRTADVLDLLARLVDKSLVLAEERDGAGRYRMLEAIREFAREKLAEAGEERETIDVHLAWYVRLAERSESASRGPEQRRWHALLEAEHDNLRAALRRALADGRVEQALRLCGALGRFWEAHSHLSEGRAWTEAALAAGAGLPSPLRAKALHAVGILALRQGSYETARAYFESAVELWRQSGSPRDRADTLRMLGYVDQFLGEYERAERLYEESLSYFREAADTLGIAGATGDLGILAMDKGDHERAIACFEESLRLDRLAGNTWAVATMLHNLGEALQRSGDCARAFALLEESIALARELGNRHLTAYSLHVLGNIANDLGDFERAVASFREALELDRELGDKGGMAYALEGFACTAAAQGDAARAMRLVGAAAALREEIKMILSPAETTALEAYLSRAREALGAEATERALAEGRSLYVERALDEARNV